MSPLFFREQGEGQNILFIHGFCETGEIWEDFIQLLTRSYKVITVDLPGFGQSPILQNGFSVDDVGDAVAQWMSTNGLKDSLVVGHSLGGYVTLSLAERHRKFIKGYGLFHSSVFADSDEKKENRNKVIEFVRNNGAQPFIDTFTRSLFYDKTNDSVSVAHAIASQTSATAIMEYSRAMRDRPDRTSIWKKNEIEGFLIAGKEDSSIPIEISREMAKIASMKPFFELEKTAHMGFFEAKSECQEIIKRFADHVFAIK